MMGATHVMSGAAVGAASLPLAPVSSVFDGVVWVGGWGAAALLPDLDHHNSKLARFWGTPSNYLARIVKRLAGGHREATHDALVGPPVFAAFAALSVLHPVATFVFVVVTIGMMLRAWEWLIPGRWEHVPSVNATVAVVITGAIVVGGPGVPWWFPITVAGGALVHIAGDACTRQGVPIPGTTLRWRLRGKKSPKVALSRMSTGGRLEAWIGAGFTVAFVGSLGASLWVMTAP